MREGVGESGDDPLFWRRKAPIASLSWSQTMEDKSQFNHCAEMLSALAAPERLRVLRLLRDGPKSVGDIAAELGIALVNLSHHLTVLRHAKLVHKERQGRYILYSLPPGILEGDGANSGTEHLNLGCCRLELPCPDE